jgi:histidyl-tRNA synthetase
MAQSAFQNIKGTFDILPFERSGDAVQSASSDHWRFVEEQIRAVFHRFDFDEIRTPIIEPVELIARGIGEHTDIVSKEMFSFSRGNDHYVLRPEITAPVIRSFLQHTFQQFGEVHRLYYMGPCFRAERPQKGRYRQFHQFGCELIGAEDARADAEVILVMLAIYRSFGLDGFRLRINSLGNPESRKAYTGALREYFASHLDALSQTSRTRLEENPLRLLDTKIAAERKLLLDAPSITEFLNEEDQAHFARVKALLSAAGESFVEDPFLVRGLDYYTRTAFELELDSLGAQNALAGGGRYDLLGQELGARAPLPAVGFAAGFERLLLALAAQHVDMPGREAPAVFLVSVGPAAQDWVFEETQKLREAGLRATFDEKGRSLKAQLREANRRKAAWVIVAGGDEISSRQAQAKNMTSGDEYTVPFDQLQDFLLEKLGGGPLAT